MDRARMKSNKKKKKVIGKLKVGNRKFPKNDPKTKGQKRHGKSSSTKMQSSKSSVPRPSSVSGAATLTLRERMMKRLDAARFRQVNEELDSMTDVDPRMAFHSDISNFENYHKAYKERIEHWPQNPLDVMIDYIKKKVPSTHVIADFGCGEARLAASVPNPTHSFDLFALNERVTPGDMSSTGLKDQSVDLAIFCLSLMGTEVGKYIAEANRVLKPKGILRIAEVASRFPKNDAGTFIKRMKKFGFVTKDRVREGKKNASTPSDQVFLLLEFLKIRAVRVVKGKLPSITLTPCAYKKR